MSHSVICSYMRIDGEHTGFLFHCRDSLQSLCTVCKMTGHSGSRTYSRTTKALTAYTINQLMQPYTAVWGTCMHSVYKTEKQVHAIVVHNGAINGKR